MVHARSEDECLAYMEFFICSRDLPVRLRAVNALCKLSYPEIAHSGSDALRRPVHDGSTAVDIA